MPSEMFLFAPEHSRSFGESVSRHLGTSLHPLEEREFADGEHKSRPLVSVRGKDVYVLAGLYDEPQWSVNDKLLRLLFLIGALKDARARRVTVVAPYLCYTRKDRKTKARDPVTTRYVATLFEAVGTDCVVTVDVHNQAAYQNAFRCATEHLETSAVFAEYAANHLPDAPLVVVSPDAGGTKRAEQFRQRLARIRDHDIPLVWLEKQRSEGVVSGQNLVGDVRGRTAILVDDLISTGTTLVRAARTCREQGATQVWAAATHGLFTGEASETLSDPVLGTLLVTTTVPFAFSSSSPLQDKVEVLDVAPLVAETIRRLHTDASITALMK